MPAPVDPPPPSLSPGVPSPAYGAYQAARAAAYPATDPRLAPLRAALAARLRPVLRAAGVAYPNAAFEALVLDMARVALRWALADAARRPGTPSLSRPAVTGPPT